MVQLSEIKLETKINGWDWVCRCTLVEYDAQIRKARREKITGLSIRPVTPLFFNVLIYIYSLIIFKSMLFLPLDWPNIAICTMRRRLHSLRVDIYLSWCFFALARVSTIRGGIQSFSSSSERSSAPVWCSTSVQFGQSHLANSRERAKSTHTHSLEPSIWNRSLQISWLAFASTRYPSQYILPMEMLSNFHPNNHSLTDSALNTNIAVCFAFLRFSLLDMLRGLFRCAHLLVIELAN